MTAVIIFYISAIVGIPIMKKIEPDNKVYPVWVGFVVVAFTCFLIWYES